MNGRSLSKNGGRTQQAGGTAEAKAECWESAQQVKSDRRVWLRSLEERGTKECWEVQLGIGCAEPPTPDADTGEHQDQMVHNNITGSPSCSLTPRDWSRPFRALPPLLHTKTHLLGRSRWQMGATDPVILSPVPESERPFPSGF